MIFDLVKKATEGSVYGIFPNKDGEYEAIKVEIKDGQCFERTNSLRIANGRTPVGVFPTLGSAERAIACLATKISAARTEFEKKLQQQEAELILSLEKSEWMP